MDDAIKSRQGAHHQSTIATLLDQCSWRYFLAHEVKVPQGPQGVAAVVGTSFHAGAQFHEHTRMLTGNPPAQAGVIDAADAELSELSDEGIKYEDRIPSYEAARTVLHRAIERWYEADDPKIGVPLRDRVLTWEPIAVEHTVEALVPSDVGLQLPLRGTLDCLYETPKGPLIVDWKTAWSFSYWRRDGSNKRTQATWYSWLAQLAGLTADLAPVEYHIVRTAEGETEQFQKARLVGVKPDQLDLAELVRRVRQAEWLIDTKDYEPNPDTPLCSQLWCPYYEPCQTDRGLHPDTIRPVRVTDRPQTLIDPFEGLDQGHDVDDIRWR